MTVEVIGPRHSASGIILRASLRVPPHSGGQEDVRLNKIFRVPRTHSVRGTICICLEQLGMSHFLSKNLENFQQNCEHRESWILTDLDSASKVGKSAYPPSPHPPPDIGNFGFLQIWTQHQKFGSLL